MDTQHKTCNKVDFVTNKFRARTDLLKWPISRRCTGKQAPSSEDGLHADKYGTRKHSSEDHDQHPIHNQLQEVKGFSVAQPRQTSLS